MLSPSLPLGGSSGLWGNRLLQYIEATTRSPDFMSFFNLVPLHSFTILTSVSHPSGFLLVLWDPPTLLPHSGTPSNSSSSLFSFSGNLRIWECCRRDNGPISEPPTETELTARACH